MTNRLVCEECGYTREVKLEDDNGREVTVDEYMAALKIAGMRLVCNDCRGRGVTPRDAAAEHRRSAAEE